MTHLTPLALLYLCVGVGCAVVLTRRDRVSEPASKTRRWAVDAALLVVAWPLYAPIALASPGERAPGARGSNVTAEESEPRSWPPREDGAPGEARADRLDALRRAGGAPLATLLPDIETGRRLTQRLEVAQRHVDDIDGILAQARFSEEAAFGEWQRLSEGGDQAAAALVDNRLQIIRRLRNMRDRFEQEMATINETLTQLELQAEMVRMAGTASDDTRDLIEDLMSGLRGLECLMADAYPTIGAVDGATGEAP